MIFQFFDKKFSSLADKSVKSTGFAIKQNGQLAEELHKPIITKFKNVKYILHFKAIFGVLILQICK